jgi:hypothetical protein
MANAIAQNPKLQAALSTIDILPGETVEFAIQADGYFLGSNPIQKLVAKFQAFITKLTGGYIRVFMVITNQRVIMIQQMQVWCGCGKVAGNNVISLSSLAEVGSRKETQMCCIHTRTISLQSLTQLHQLVITKAGDQAVRDFMGNLSAVIVANAQHR